jgi:hypothetical protein
LQKQRACAASSLHEGTKSFATRIVPRKKAGEGNRNPFKKQNIKQLKISRNKLRLGRSCYLILDFPYKIGPKRHFKGIIRIDVKSATGPIISNPAPIIEARLVVK